MIKKFAIIFLISLLAMPFLMAEDTEPVETDENTIEFDRSLIVNPSTLTEKFSYAFGIYLFQNYGENVWTYFSMFQQMYYPELDLNFAYLGMYDLVTGSLLYDLDELNSFLSEYPADYAARMAAKAEENLKIAEDFLEQNKAKSDVNTTESGLQYQVITQGNGARAQASDSVELDYELKLLDGTVIDSSYQRGEHSTFSMSQVIEGFKEGVMLMPMGSHYIFYIHPDLGYGETATGGMEPNSLLIFEVETYSII